jgi:tRNA (guanine-N7-)-methyltransferase
MDSGANHRHVVSFIRRGGRLTERQQNAWDAVGDRFVIDVPRGRSSTSVAPGFRFDPSGAFGRTAPLVLEIGSGRGDALVESALQHPEWDFLALEVYVPGVAQTLVNLRHMNIENVRLAVVDASEAIDSMLRHIQFHEIRIWFPDPWHKLRHHKRRLFTDEFTARLAAILEPGGVLRLATDWQDYADQMLDVLLRSPAFDTSEDWAPRFDERPLTRFESKGIRADRAIRDISAVRN